MRRRLAQLRRLSQATRRSVEKSAAGRASLADSFGRLHDDVTGLMSEAAEIAERMADEAEAFATSLEANAERGDRERRLALAAKEREEAERLRTNAARWRDR